MYDSPEKQKAYIASESGRAARRRANRKHRLRVDFGISVEQYDEMLKRQGGVCAICQKPEKHTRRGGSLRSLR